MTTTAQPKPKQIEGKIEVCCHQVVYRYWAFDNEITDDLKSALEKDAEARAKQCINEGCQSGDLNCLYTNGDEQEEIRGWWEIDNG